MKRSEMLKLIEGLFEIAQKYPNQMNAENLLSWLDEKGMLPPRLPEDHCQALMSLYYGGFNFHQWEEDFEQDKEAVLALQRRLTRKNRSGAV